MALFQTRFRKTVDPISKRTDAEQQLNPTIAKAIEIAQETASFRWWDYLIYRITTKTSETLYSLDKYNIDYLLKQAEIIDHEDYVRALHRKDSDQKDEMRRKWETFKK